MTTGMAKLVRTAALAKHLGFTPEAIRRAAREGKLPFRRVGHAGWMLFDLSEVEQALRPVREDDHDEQA